MDACPERFSWFFYWIPKVQKLLFRGTVCHVRRTLARSAFHGFSIGFQRCKGFSLLNLCSAYSHFQSRVLFAPPWQYAPRHRILSFEPAQFLRALSEQSALCTSFLYFPQASLHSCGRLFRRRCFVFRPDDAFQKRFSWF